MLFWHLGVTAAVIFMTLGRRRIDYRVVLLGAILPDLIDKPIGRIFFEKEFQTSRLFGHTLLVWVVVLLAIQLTLRGPTARRWFILPIAAMLHLALDGMWNDPVTLFWPLFGTEFPKVPVQDYWLEVFLRPLEHPWVLAQEIVGLGLLLYLGFAYRLHERATRREFIRSGSLTEPRGAKQKNFK
jgi:inner membrane protein